MSSINLRLKRTLSELEPRGEPYFDSAPIGSGAGRYLGFRKVSAERGTWVAKLRDARGCKRYQSLGPNTPQFGFEEAYGAALKWFAEVDGGAAAPGTKHFTVEQACQEYIADRSEKKSATACAHQAEIIFKRLVYGRPIAALKLAQLKTVDVEVWRRSIKPLRKTVKQFAKASVNRYVQALLAALNLAAENRGLSALSQELARFEHFDTGDSRRTTYLDQGARRALLAKTQGELRELVEALMLTGARPSELVRAKRSDFNEREGVITLTTMKGNKIRPRHIPLSDAAVKLFARLAKGRSRDGVVQPLRSDPNAPLLECPTGGAWRFCSQWDKQVKTAVRRSGVDPKTTLYTLRHSYITDAILGGMPALEVARLTGTSLMMIEKHYGHLVMKEARERLNRIAMI